MKKLGLFALLFAIILILSGLGLELTQASADASQEMGPIVSGAAKEPWFVDTIETDGNVGSHVSIAFHPKSGRPWIIYYDETHHDLRLAKRITTANGNCGPNNTWFCGVVDSTGDVGMYNSLAFHQTETGYTVGISYYDATNKALKYASLSCDSTPCIVNWEKMTIAQGSGLDIGRYTSLAFDDTGTPHIAYQMIDESTDPDLDPATYYLLHAHPVDSGANCGDGEWSCDLVEISFGGDQGIGMYTSLAVSDAGTPFIAYYDGENGNLKFAVYLGTGGNCGVTQWRCMTVDGGPGDEIGLHASLFIHEDDEIKIAYYDDTNNKLKYAVVVDSNDANCGDGVGSGGSQVWRCSEIDDMGGNAPIVDLDMTRDADGYPAIAYTKAGSNILMPTDLKVARPSGAFGFVGGNCGPFPGWQCDELDGGGTQNLFEAKYVSVAVGPNGLAAIAYSERDGGDYNLKIAYQQMVVFLPLTTR